MQPMVYEIKIDSKEAEKKIRKLSNLVKELEKKCGPDWTNLAFISFILLAVAIAGFIAGTYS